MELEFLRFERDGLEGWLLRCEYFFEVGQITPENRVKVPTVHLEGRALQWHQMYVIVKGADACTDWNEYVNLLGAQFGSSVFDDPIVELRNLKQEGSL